MKSLDSRFSMHSSLTLKWFAGILSVVSFGGFLDSVYLSAKHFLGFSVSCSIFTGCEEVLNSSFATLWGVPIALFGTVFYLSIFVCSVAFLDTKNSAFLRIACLLPFAGFLFSLWLLYVQASLLHAFCMWCIFSAILSMILFFVSATFWIFQRRKV